MKITKISDCEKINFMELLLLADEDVKMIEKYLYRGELFALYDDGLKSVCVVSRESDDVCELKNIATYEKWNGKGYGSKLLEHIFHITEVNTQPCLLEQGTFPGSYSFTRKTVLRFRTGFPTFSQITTTTPYLIMTSS